MAPLPPDERNWMTHVDADRTVLDPVGDLMLVHPEWLG